MRALVLCTIWTRKFAIYEQIRKNTRERGRRYTMRSRLLMNRCCLNSKSDQLFCLIESNDCVIKAPCADMSTL